MGRTWTETGPLPAALAAAALALSTVATPAGAQGWIEPGVDRGGLSVEKVRSEVRVRLEGRVAHLEVSEWFVNRGRRLAEGDYLYPLPGEAVFDGFSLFQGDAELRGEIMDAGQARAIYEEIVRRKADPALIELAGHGLLRARVFPIQPGEERKITLRYTQALQRAGDALQLEYAGAVRGGGPVAQPRDPVRPGGRVPDGLGRPAGSHPGPGADEGTGQRGLTERVPTRFEVTAERGADYLDPFSPTHEVEVRRDRGRLTVSIDDEIRGRLSLFFPLAGRAVGMSVATHRPVGEDGYFMLTLSPDRSARAAEPRDLTVVMDVSGSMSGEKIEQAREALRQLLASVGPDDRFRLVAFSSSLRLAQEGWSSTSERDMERAHAWIDQMVADGGTNIDAALDEAFRLESPRERLPVVIFLTDGLPSVGEQSPERLADRAERRAGRARVFAFGVGHDVNTHLLDRLSEATRGSTDYVQPGENVERVVSLLATKIRHPVLTDLHLSDERAHVTEIFPVRLPDLFAGEELVLFGRYRAEGPASMAVRGRRGGSDVTYATELTLPRASEANAYIPRLWAARKLGHLERQIWTEGETESLVEQMRQLALRYGIPSRYTAYLVEEPDLVAGGPPSGGPGPVLNQSTGANLGGAPAAPAEASGAGAVRMADEARARREARSSAALSLSEAVLAAEIEATFDDARPTRMIAGRIFHLSDGVWTDAAHREGRPVTRVRAFGRAYFDLLEALPELRGLLRELGAAEGADGWLIGGADASLQIGEDGADRLSDTEIHALVRAFRGA